MTIELSTFLKFAISGLESSQARADMLAYFKLNEDGTGEPQFNLNNQLTRKNSKVYLCHSYLKEFFQQNNQVYLQH